MENPRSSDKHISMSQSYDTIFENVLSYVIEKVKNTTIITTGFRHLDKLIFGLRS